MFLQREIALNLPKLIFKLDSLMLLSQRQLHRCKRFNDTYRTSTALYHTTSTNRIQEPSEKDIVVKERFFVAPQQKNKTTFLEALKVYDDPNDKFKRGHIEFIRAALKYMNDYGVEADLEVYKKLLDVFPKGKMIAKNLIQAEFFHFARHQDCALEVLDQMEYYGVMPDKEIKEIILLTFGVSSLVYKKYAKMMYWMPKLKNINPFLLPDPLPDCVRELARLALKKMSVDKRTHIQEFDAEKLEDSTDKTWIMSAQSPSQQELINEHSEEKSLYVEGPSLIWLRRLSMTYFILRADPKIKPVVEEEDPDDVSNLFLHMFGERKPNHSLTLRPSSIHEQEEGVVLGMCCTGTSSKDSVLSWIRFLRRSNPKLDKIPILFKIRSSPTALVAVNVSKKTVTEEELEEESVPES